MEDILHRYDNCLICNKELIFQYHDGHSVNGTFKKTDESYILTYNNKSKLHKVIFDLNFNILKNNGFHENFFLVKHCPQCFRNSNLDNKLLTLGTINDSSIFYMLYLNTKKKEKLVLLEESLRFVDNNICYGWHAKFNVKSKIWNISLNIIDKNKKISEDMFIKTLETNNATKFSSLECVIEKLNRFYTFS